MPNVFILTTKDRTSCLHTDLTSFREYNLPNGESWICLGETAGEFYGVTRSSIATQSEFIYTSDTGVYTKGVMPKRKQTCLVLTQHTSPDMIMTFDNETFIGIDR